MKHTVILVPGLGDRILRHTWFTRQWEKDGIKVVIHTAPWNKTEEKFEPKLDRLLQHIDQLSNPQTNLTLIGTSAGASLVINAFAKRKSKIHKVINVCGRVRKGNSIWLPLIIAAKGHPAFYESVIACENEISKLTTNDKAKIMTVSPWPIDGIVPMSCVPINGATNLSIPVPFHALGIGAALSFFRSHLINFIKR